MFKLSENIDPNKVFIVNRSELIGKLSPNIYANNFHFKSKIYPLFKLTDLAFINPTTTFSNIQQQEDITFIPMEAINQNLGIIDVEYTKKIEETKGYTKFKENDLIWAKITPCMQNGKSAIVRNTINGYACGSTEFFIIRCKTNTILIEYIHFILRDKRILKTAMNFFGGSAGQQRVSKDFLLNLLIPLPPLEIQQQIVDLYEKAYTEKQQKEAEAQKLLDSIDDYLLGELGITLPKEEEHLPQNNDKNNSYNLDNDNPLVKKGRLFLTNLSEVTGKRWDAFEFKNRKLKLGDGNYPNKTLKHLAYLLKGQSITSNEIEKGDYPVIAGGQISPYTHNRYNFKGNVITISASGAYSGYVWYHNYPIFASDCTVVFSKEESEITTLYLSEILKLKQKEIYNLQQGAGQPHVYARDLEKINIPIPSLQKQKDITNKITAIREEAKKLQLEAINTLETAKRNIEQMILGD